MSKKYNSEKQWYVIHTYVGYEEKVAEAIRQRADSLDMADKILQVLVPKEKQIEVKNGKRKTVSKKIFPGYVFVQLKLTEDAWYVVRNTQGVTGFVGSGLDPTPASQDDMDNIMKRMGAEDVKHNIDYKPGEVVSIIDGPFKGFDGSVSEVDDKNGKLKVMVSMFGRETSVELDALQVKKG
jgi:transcriptional antiterminator NusG